MTILLKNSIIKTFFLHFNRDIEAFRLCCDSIYVCRVWLIIKQKDLRLQQRRYSLIFFYAHVAQWCEHSAFRPNQVRVLLSMDYLGNGE